MKKILLYGSLIAMLSGLALSSTSCNRKAGCPAVEDAQVKTDRKGRLPTRGGNSQLFPKKMRRN